MAIATLDCTRIKEQKGAVVVPHRRIALFGLFGIGNLGNESTLLVALYHLRRRAPHAAVTCVCDAVPDFAKTYGVAPLPFDPTPLPDVRYAPFQALKFIYRAVATALTEPDRLKRAMALLRGTDRFIVVGTGALDDLGELPWGMPARVFRWTKAARAIGATVQLLAVGAGPIKSAASRSLMTRAVANSQVRSYRDTYSREYMATLGVGSEKDEVVPDLVFSWPTEWLPKLKPASSPPKVVGVGVMAYFGWNVDKARGHEIYTAYIEKMARFVRWLLDAGYDVRLLIGERGTDSQSVRDLIDAIGTREVAEAGDRLRAPAISSVHDVFEAIMDTDMVVASRFHNLVFALALGRPVISVGYAPKFDVLMQEMDLAAYSQRIEDLDLFRLQAQVQELASKHAEAAAVVKKKSAEYRERLERLFDLTFGSGDR